MSFSILAIIQAIVWLVVGAAFLIVPRQWVAPLGIALTAEGAFFARLLGAAFLGLAAMSWLGREASETNTQLQIALPNLVTNGLAAALHGADLLRGGLHNNRAWGLVVLIGALAVGWLLIGIL